MSFSTDECRSKYHQRMRERLLQSIRGDAIVVSIVAAGTYRGVLRGPQPLGHNDGSNAPPSSYSHVLFFYFNGFSFFFAACGLLQAAMCFLSSLVLPYTGASICVQGKVDAEMKSLAITTAGLLYAAMFLALSLTSWAVAFPLAGLATMRGESGVIEKLPLMIACAVGILVFLQALLLFARSVVRFVGEIRASDPQLWRAMKRETVCGKVVNWCMEVIQRR